MNDVDIWYDEDTGHLRLVANTIAQLDILGKLLADSESTAEAYDLYLDIIYLEDQLENVA